MLIAKGTFYNTEMGGTCDYNFAFYCKAEGEPIFCFALRSDLFGESVFEEICKTISLTD